MKKILKYIVSVQMVVLAFALFSMGGCKSYDDPAPEKIHTDADMVGKRFTTIAAVKQMYTDVHGQEIGKAVVIDSQDYPSFLEQKDNIAGGTVDYESYPFVATIDAWNRHNAGLIPKPAAPEPGSYEGPTYAFKNPKNNLNYYGTALFKFGASTTNPTHNLLMRTSGFSKFALDLIPANGKKVNITAIYNKYSDKHGVNPDYIRYQLLINDSSDVEVLK